MSRLEGPALPPSSDRHDADSVLLFRLDEETFAVPVASVDEILDPQPATPVPHADPLSPGLINVRGAIVPMLDMRRRLAMPAAAPTETARIIVFETLGAAGGTERLAVLADAVDRVVAREAATLEPLPELGTCWPADCIAGSFRDGATLVVCLDPAALFADAVPTIPEDRSSQ